MRFKCYDCGHLFEEGEEAVWYESGEFWGAPFQQRMSGCPYCHGAYGEVSECEECGERHYTEEMIDGLCEDCRIKYQEEELKGLNEKEEKENA